METLRKKMILQLATLGFLICVLVVAAYVLNSVSSDSKSYAAKLTSDTRSLESKIQKFKSDNLRFQQAIDIWENMDEGERAFAGLRLSEAKLELDRMIRKYWLSNVKTTFSKPVLTDHPQFKDEYKIARSEVSLSFEAISDAMALEFLEEMNRDFPGHIMMTRVNIDKTQDLSKTTIKEIASGERPALFKGLVEFEWRDIKK